MNYAVIISEKIETRVNKKLKNKELVRRFYKKLTKLETSPKTHGKPLRHPLQGIWELYFEKRYRILFEIYENKKVVLIVGFKHKDEM